MSRRFANLGCQTAGTGKSSKCRALKKTPARSFPLLLQRGSNSMPSTVCVSGKKAVFLHAFNCSHAQDLPGIVTAHSLPHGWARHHRCHAHKPLLPSSQTSRFRGVLALPWNRRQREGERAHKRKWGKKRKKKKSESKHIQKVHAEPDFFHCGVSNIHHSKFKPDFQEPRPQWLLLWYLMIW